jgi:hypothetical protein
MTMAHVEKTDLDSLHDGLFYNGPTKG